jgi:hypothetical protein
MRRPYDLVVPLAVMVAVLGLLGLGVAGWLIFESAGDPPSARAPVVPNGPIADRPVDRPAVPPAREPRETNPGTRSAREAETPAVPLEPELAPPNERREPPPAQPPPMRTRRPPREGDAIGEGEYIPPTSPNRRDLSLPMKQAQETAGLSALRLTSLFR